MPTQAAPTLLIGLGPVGRRVCDLLAERLANSVLGQKELLVVGHDYGPSQCKQAIERLTENRRIAAAASDLDVTSPSGRQVRLRLVAIANLGEAQLSALLELSKWFMEYPHPGPGLEVELALDVSVPEDVVKVAPGLPALLEACDQLAASTGDRIQVFVAHRRLCDGTNIAHPNLQSPEERSPDSFEKRLAQILEAALASERPRTPVLIDEEGPVGGSFATLGGGSCIFPRKLLLESTSKLLAASLLDQTRIDPSQPTPSFSFPTRDELTTMLAGKLPGIEVHPRRSPAPRQSFFARWSGEGTPRERAGVGLVHGESTARIEALDLGEIVHRFEVLVDDLQRTALSGAATRIDIAAQDLASELCAKIREKTDSLVTDHIGGVELASQYLEWLQGEVLARLSPEEREAFVLANPDVPTLDGPSDLPQRYLPVTSSEFPESTSDLVAQARSAMSRMPRFPAVLARGLAAGAVLGAVSGFGLPGTLGMTATVSGGLGWFAKRRAERLERMRRDLLNRASDRIGQELYDRLVQVQGAWIVEIDGDKIPLLGVLPRVWEYIEYWELPAVRGFQNFRDTTIETLRRIPDWPDGFYPGMDWLELEDPWLLAGKHDFRLGDEASLKAAQKLLVQGVYRLWRQPSFPEIEARSCSLTRNERLSEYENLPFGDFFRQLSDLHANEADRESFYSKQVCGRMDSLARKCLPMAPFADNPPAEGVHHRSLGVNAPSSLRWHEAQSVVHQAPVDEGALASNAEFSQVSQWMTPGSLPNIVDIERDGTDALAVLQVRSAQELLEFFGTDYADPVPVDEPPDGPSDHPDPVPPVPDQPYRRSALLIGVSEYRQKPLPKPVENVRELGSKLRSVGFDVTILENSDLGATKEAIQKWTSTLDSQSLAWFCFNGHGAVIDGSHVLQTAEGSFLELEFVFSHLSSATGPKVFVLDCCRVNHPGRGDRADRISLPSNSYLAYATSAFRLAWDGYYTPELIPYVAVPGYRIEDVFMATRQAVMRKSRGRQLPVEESTLVQPVYLAQGHEEKEQ